MDRMNGFFSRSGGMFFIMGVSVFAIGLALGNRTIWIIGLVLLVFGLLTGAGPTKRH